MAEENLPSSSRPYKDKDLLLLPVPRYLRTDVADLAVSLKNASVLALVTSITVGNQYYNQPLLIQLAEDFGVSEGSISNVPTLAQAGNAAGLLFLAPLGDLVRRRQLLLLTTIITLPVLACLATAPDARTFKAMSCLLGFFTVAPQINTPLVLDYAPVWRRSTAVSINVSGILLGMTMARVISSLVSQFSSWATAYWVAFGLQSLAIGIIYFSVPDYPPKIHAKKLYYHQILLSFFKSMFSEPAMVQLWTIAFMVSWVNMSAWSTLAFLLDEIYGYNTLQIGLFGLAGLLLVAGAPLVGWIVDRIAPWYGLILGICISMLAALLYKIAIELHLAAVIVFLLVVDLGTQFAGVSTAAKLATIDPLARARLNSINMLAVLGGGAVGNQVSSLLLLRHGSSATGAMWMGVLGVAVLICLSRGPHTSRKRWCGWKGGASLWRASLESEEAIIQATAAEVYVMPVRTNTETGLSRQEQQGVTTKRKDVEKQ